MTIEWNTCPLLVEALEDYDMVTAISEMSALTCDENFAEMVARNGFYPEAELESLLGSDPSWNSSNTFNLKHVAGQEGKRGGFTFRFWWRTGDGFVICAKL